MAKQLGRELLVKIRTSTGPDVFATLCGLNSKTFTINNSEIDVTTADCTTPGGILWTEVLAGAKRGSFSGTGFFDDTASENFLQTQVFAVGATAALQLIIPSLGMFSATFFLTSLEYSGETEGGVTYSVAGASSGAVVFA